MNQWIKNIPTIDAVDATIASQAPVSDARREEFWKSMAAAPSDPFFEVTVNDGQVSIAAANSEIR